MEPPPLGSILIRRAYGPRDPAMASGNNDDIQNLNAFLGGWSAAVARMAIPSDATLRGSSQGASAVDFQHAACYRAARRLLGILPPEAIAFPLGIDVSQLTRHGVAPTLTIHLRLAATFAPDTIAVGARALDELQQFARASDVTITPLVAFAYLEKADTDARERARGRRDDAARRGATPTARVTTGSYVRQSLARALAWLQRHYGLEVSPTPALARVGQTRSAYTATTITARHGALNTHGNRAGTPGFRPQPIGLPPMPCRCVACHGTLVQSPCTICAGDIGPHQRRARDSTGDRQKPKPHAHAQAPVVDAHRWTRGRYARIRHASAHVRSGAAPFHSSSCYRLYRHEYITAGDPRVRLSSCTATPLEGAHRASRSFGRTCQRPPLGSLRQTFP